MLMYVALTWHAVWGGVQVPGAHSSRGRRAAIAVGTLALRRAGAYCGVAWRGVAWRGVAWRGVAWRNDGTPALPACQCAWRNDGTPALPACQCACILDAPPPHKHDADEPCLLWPPCVKQPRVPRRRVAKEDQEAVVGVGVGVEEAGVAGAAAAGPKAATRLPRPPPLLPKKSGKALLPGVGSLSDESIALRCPPCAGVGRGPEGLRHAAASRLGAAAPLGQAASGCTLQCTRVHVTCAFT